MLLRLGKEVQDVPRSKAVTRSSSSANRTHLLGLRCRCPKHSEISAMPVFSVIEPKHADQPPRRQRDTYGDLCGVFGGHLAPPCANPRASKVPGFPIPCEVFEGFTADPVTKMMERASTEKRLNNRGSEMHYLTRRTRRKLHCVGSANSGDDLIEHGDNAKARMPQKEGTTNCRTTLFVGAAVLSCHRTSAAARPR